jgi:hypothetical protein
MPIRPENKARYPKNWKSEIVPAIRERSGNRCECTGQCGVRHPTLVMVQGNDPDAPGVIREPNRCGKENGDPIEMGADKPCIVLTVMHLNHQPEDNRPENLLHACQGCHNRYDAPMRAAGIKARRRAACAAGDLFCEEATNA